MIYRFGSVLAAALLAISAPVSAQSAPFYALTFLEHKQYAIRCAARYECEIQLEAGERVNDGFNAHIDQWDPHIGYSGDKELTPHLVLRPSRSGLRTNIILTTTKRTYYLLAVSTSMQQPSYYSFSYVDNTYKSLANLAIATQTALRANGGELQPAPTAPPADVASLATACFDFDYSYLVDRNVQSDHAPHARPSNEALPPSLQPHVVCSDGSHTYVEFPLQREVPSDVPISLAVTAEGDTLINYTYVASLNRFTVDGVYDSFVLEIGSQARPLRLRIFHAGRGNPPSGKRDPRPIPIARPADLAVLGSPSPSATPQPSQGSQPTPGLIATRAPSAMTATPKPVRSRLHRKRRLPSHSAKRHLKPPRVSRQRPPSQSSILRS